MNTEEIWLPIILAIITPGPYGGRIWCLHLFIAIFSFISGFCLLHYTPVNLSVCCQRWLDNNTSINLANVKALMTGEIFHWEEASFTMSWHQPRYLRTNGKYWWSSVGTTATDWNLESRTDFYELEWMKDEGSGWSCKPSWLYDCISGVRDNSAPPPSVSDNIKISREIGRENPAKFKVWASSFGNLSYESGRLGGWWAGEGRTN